VDYIKIFLLFFLFSSQSSAAYLDAIDILYSGTNPSQTNPIPFRLSDGTDFVSTFDMDNAAGVSKALSVTIRGLSNGTPVELGTAANPFRIDPTGTTPQPVTITGVALLSEQQTQTSALQLLDNIVGSSGAGTAATNSALVGGIFNSTLPTLTAGQQASKQLDNRGRNLHPVTNGRISYIAATPVGGLAVGATANQDMFRISGSATRTVYVKKIRVSMTATATQGNNIHLIKRSAANTGGTSTALALVAQSSTSTAATAAVVQYTAAPTSGAAVGPVRSQKYLIPTATALYNSEKVFEFGENHGNPIVLNGTAQGIGIVFGTAPGAGANANITVEWEEE
jgi:hypothetical protein